LKMANLNNWNGMQRLHKVGYVFWEYEWVSGRDLQSCQLAVLKYERRQDSRKIGDPHIIGCKYQHDIGVSIVLESET
jgi:hypothetical protein